MAAMVGRVAEMAQVAAALSAARGGRGRVVLVSGPAGIGKTRLVRAVAQDAGQAGLPVARGYAVDDPGAPALWPWRRLMREWPEAMSLPQADGGEPEAAARFRWFTAISAVICARADAAGGLLVVLEDMHWADHLSVLLLRHLAAELEDHPVLVVVTYRDPLAGPLAVVHPDLLRAGAQQVGLTGLRVGEVQAWLPDITGHRSGAAELAAAVHARTGGNPLYIRLLTEDLTSQGKAATPGAVAHLMAERPHLRRLVAARADALSSDARGVVDAASVLGERVDPLVLEVMTGHSPARLPALLAEAVEGGVLQEAGGGVRFEHALVRDAVYATLGAGRRMELHRLAATALAAATSPLAGPITIHWQRADGPDAQAHAQAWAETADEQARAALAHDDAARFANIAVRCARDRGVDGAELARLLIRHAEAALLANQVQACAQSCAEAADLADAAGRGDLLARAGLVIHGVGNPPVLQLVSRICTRALSDLAPGEHATRARLLAQVAVGAAETGDGPVAVGLSAEALAEAERSGDPDAVLDAIAARHLTISVPDRVVERLALGSQAVALGASGRHPMAAVWGHLWRADAALQLGNITEFDREVTALDEVAHRRGSALARWHHHRFLAARRAMVGDFAGARHANDAARQLGERPGDVSLTGLSDAFSSQLAILRGDPAEMPDGWEELFTHAPAMPLVRLVYPVQHALAGDLDRARAEFEEFRNLPETYPYGVRWAGTIGMVALAAVLLEDTDVAATAYTQLLDTAHYYSGDGSGAVFSHGANCQLLGELARVTGRYKDAIRHFAEAVAMNTRIGARPFTALSRLGWAQTLITLGPGPRGGPTAAELLTKASAEFHRLDMPGPLTAASLALNTLHHPPRPATPLTARESEIAHLVGQALSNKEIAGRLYLSERTVESHVRNTLNKLGFHTRTQIATWVQRHQ